MRSRSNTESSEYTELIADRSSDKIELKQLMKYFTDPNFHLLFWPASIMLGLETMCLSNVSTFARSFGLWRYAQIILTIEPIVFILVKLIIGIISDSLITRVPRSAFLLSFSLVNTFVMLFSTFLFYSEYMQGIYFMSLSIASAAVQTITPSLIIYMFCKEFFPTGKYEYFYINFFFIDWKHIWWFTIAYTALITS